MARSPERRTGETYEEVIELISVVAGPHRSARCMREEDAVEREGGETSERKPPSRSRKGLLSLGDEQTIGNFEEPERWLL